jgi:uncharacterized protein YndB with AHSA1/START domain
MNTPLSLSVTTTIQAAPEVVWEVMSDVERWPEWTPTVTRIQRLDRGPLAVGSRVHVRQPKLPPATWRISELQPGLSFTWVTRSPGVRVIASHRVEARPGGSQATLSIAFDGLLGPLVGRWARALSERYLQLEAAGLKRRSEEPHTPPVAAPSAHSSTAQTR